MSFLCDRSNERLLMIMADVLKIALIIIGFLLCYVVYWLASAALFPAVVERAKQQ